MANKSRKNHVCICTTRCSDLVIFIDPCPSLGHRETLDWTVSCCKEIFDSNTGMAGQRSTAWTKELWRNQFPKCRLYWCFCLGWCSSFVGSESGQKQSVRILQNMVYNTTQHPPSPHINTVHCLWSVLYVYFRKGVTIQKSISLCTHRESTAVMFCKPSKKRTTNHSASVL